MDDANDIRMRENRSRRSFFRRGSAALAGTALLGLTAKAQERANVRQAEHDHSADNPGQENKALLHENPSSNTPPPTDFGDSVPIWYSFDLVKKRIQEGGWTHEVTQRELPSSRDIAGVNMRLTAGSFRELHWHTADEWSYMLYGHARVTVMKPDGTMFVDDVSEGDSWVFPAGYPHSIQGLGPDGCEFLLVFNQGMFSEDGTFLLTEWTAHTPPEVLRKNFKLDDQAINRLPTTGRYIFPANVQGTLADARAAIGAQNCTPEQFTFRLKALTPTRKTQGGEVRIADSRNFLVSKHIAAALVIVNPGGMRELHWHPNASEWQFYISGKARMTVFTAVGNARTMDYNANDVGYIPAVAGHYIENTGDSDLVFLELFAASEFQDVSLNNWLRRLPSGIVAQHLNLDVTEIKQIPPDKEEVI